MLRIREHIACLHTDHLFIRAQIGSTKKDIIRLETSLAILQKKLNSGFVRGQEFTEMKAIFDAKAQFLKDLQKGLMELQKKFHDIQATIYSCEASLRRDIFY